MGLTTVPPPTVAPQNKTANPAPVKKRTLPDYCPSGVQKICKDTQSKELADNYILYSYIESICTCTHICLDFKSFNCM